MTSEKTESPLLRRSLLGLRRADALRLIDDLRGQVTTIAATLRSTWDENQALKRQLAEARAELARRRTHAGVEAEARVAASRLLAAAEEQAALVELQAAERVSAAGGRFVDLLRAREQLLLELRATVQSYREVVDRAGTAQPEAEEEVIAAPTPLAEPALHVVPDLPSRQVVLEVGPFGELEELSAFERTLAPIEGVEDVYVRQFINGRASIDLSLRGEGDLVDRIGRHLPYPVSVEPTRPDNLIVEIGPEAAAHA